MVASSRAVDRPLDDPARPVVVGDPSTQFGGFDDLCHPRSFAENPVRGGVDAYRSRAMPSSDLLATRRRSPLGGVLVAASLLLATACGSSDESSSETVAGSVDAESDSVDVDAVDDGDGDGDDGDGDGDGEAESAVDSSGVDLEVSVGSVEGTTLGARVDVAASLPVSVEIEASSPDHSVRTPRSAAVDAAHSLPLVGLRADRTYDVRVSAYDADEQLVGETTRTFTSGALPDFLPDFDLVSTPAEMSPGFTLLEPDPAGEEVGHLFALDDAGEVVWYHRSDETVSGVTLSDEGTLLGTRFFDAFVEFDVLGDEVGRWRLPAEEDASPSTVPSVRLEIPWTVSPSGDDGRIHTPHHEFIRLPDGNYIGLVRINESISVADQQRFCPGDEEEWEVVGDLVIEFDAAGTVLRTWNLADAIDVDDFPGVHLCETDTLFSTPTERDWTHANAVEYDPVNDLLLVSVRHTDQIIAFERGDSIGHQREVAYVFGVGGDVEYDGEPFFHQHAPEVQADGSLLVYDNGNFRTSGEEFSRAVQFDLDEASDGSWSATQIWEHRVDGDDGEPIAALFLGDADRLSNGNVLIAHGGIGIPGDTDVNVRVIEVVPDGAAGGEIVFDIRFGTPEDGITTYRAERIETFYTGPLWAG